MDCKIKRIETDPTLSESQESPLKGAWPHGVVVTGVGGFDSVAAYYCCYSFPHCHK